MRSPRTIACRRDGPNFRAAPKRPVALMEARCPLPKVGPSYEGSPGGLGGRRVVADLRRNDPR